MYHFVVLIVCQIKLAGCPHIYQLKVIVAKMIEKHICLWLYIYRLHTLLISFKLLIISIGDTSLSVKSMYIMPKYEV